jgi:hypothetical protein
MTSLSVFQQVTEISISETIIIGDALGFTFAYKSSYSRSSSQSTQGSRIVIGFINPWSSERQYQLKTVESISQTRFTFKPRNIKSSYVRKRSPANAHLLFILFGRLPL